MARIKKKEAVLILENIRSTHNVGSIFRTADAAGVTKMYLVGYTPLPVDRFNRPRKDITKVSLGAENSVPWEYKKSIASLISSLKKDGYKIVSLEQNEKSISYTKAKLSKFALILGNEVSGVSKASLKNSDAVVEIPMKGKKESLNVSVAAGIALFQLLQ